MNIGNDIKYKIFLLIPIVTKGYLDFFNKKRLINVIYETFINFNLCTIQHT